MEKAKEPKVIIEKPSGGFGIGNLLGLVFVLVGIAYILILTKFNLPFNLEAFRTYIEYGVAAAAIIGGISMLFYKKK